MSNTAIEHIRHSLAHLLARSVLEHYPEAKLTLGPAIDTGFYYDIDFGDEDFSDDDLKQVQTTMRKLLGSWETFARIPVSADEARDFFADNPYKLELIDEIDAAGEEVSLYYSGPKDDQPSKADLLAANSVIFGKGFVDLCHGGHVNAPAADIDAKSFKLDSVAGAYWRGDENNEMLTRIYGLAFADVGELNTFVERREEAKKRDHRKLGKQLDLFTFSDLIGSGLPLFTPKGALMRDLIVEKIHSIQAKFGYERVTIPHLAKEKLYEVSGHREKFEDGLFMVRGQSNDDEYVMKPMNCPHHTQIYASRPRSYRDLPIRYQESTMVYRDEQSGELSGLSRVRSITQDDGHVFCTPEQIDTEINNIVTVIREFYTALNMWSEDTYWASLSVRDPETPERYLGDDETWQLAEQALKAAAEDNDVTYERTEGEAAFYGPKLDFMFTDALGREWQLATIQLDFNMPERFDLTYTAEDGSKQTPVMIHRAIAGSLERFMSIIIEHFAGDFPLWLAPVQVALLPIADEHAEYAQEIATDLKEAGLRPAVIAGSDSLGKRIRGLHEQKIPVFAVIGDDETAQDSISFETRTTDEEKSIDRADLGAELTDWFANLE